MSHTGRLRLLIFVTFYVGMLAGAAVFTTPFITMHAAPTDPIAFSLRSLGYPDQPITGAQPALDYVIPGPGVQPGVGQLTFVFSHSPLLVPDFSLVRIAVNDTPVYEARLDDTNIGRTRVTITVPSERFVAGPNRIAARFALRQPEGCDDEAVPVATIYSDTALRYGPPTRVPPPDLRDFPAQFTSQTRPDAAIVNPVTALRGDPTIAVPLGIATPADATPAERSAAATVLLALGVQHAVLPVEPRALFIADALGAARTQNTIIVGRGSTIPADALRDAPLGVISGVWQQANGVAIPPGAGVLLMVTPPDDPRGRILIVSGNDDVGITQAATLLNSVTPQNALTGQGAIITAVPPSPVAPAGGTRYDLRDLGLTEGDTTVTGFGARDITATFVLPGAVIGAATLQIALAHAPTLEPRLSTITAFINDQPLLTQMLDGVNGERRVLTASVPANVLRPGRNTLRFAFVLRGLDAVPCRIELSGPAQYATLFPGTNLTVPIVSPDLANLSLDGYPFPFATGDDPLTVIVGDGRDRDALTTAYRLALNAGTAARRGTVARILTAAEATPALLRGQHAIAVGVPGENAALDPAAGQLFFVTEGGQPRLRDPRTAGMAGGTMTAQFPASGTGSIGVLQLLPAPWDATRFLLVVAGADQDHRALAADALTRVRPGGREAVVTKDAQNTLVIEAGRATMPPAPPAPPASAVAVAVASLPASVGTAAIVAPTVGAASTGAVAGRPGPTLAPGVATAVLGGGVAPFPTVRPLPAGAASRGTASAATARAGTPGTHTPPAGANDPATGGIRVGTVNGVPAIIRATGTMAPGLPAASGGGLPTPVGPVAAPSGTTATVGALPGMTQGAATTTRREDTGTASPGDAVPGSVAMRTAASGGSETSAGGYVFGVPRPVVFASIAALVLTTGIAVFALARQGRRRAH